MRVSHSQGIGFSVAREIEAINVSNKTNSSKSDGLQRKDQGSRLKACNTAPTGTVLSSTMISPY